MAIYVDEVSPSCVRLVDLVTGREKVQYLCKVCRKWLDADDTVWGEDQNPYCVGCLPNQES